MTQIPGGQSPLDVTTTTSSDATRDSQTPRDREAMEDVLPSGGETSGLAPTMREELDAQVQASGGNVEQVVRDLRARIAEIDDRGMPEEGALRTRMQADRALLVAQVSYLEDQVATGLAASTREYRSASRASDDDATVGLAPATTGRASTDWQQSRGMDTTRGAVAGASTAATGRRARVYDASR